MEEGEELDPSLLHLNNHLFYSADYKSRHDATIVLCLFDQAGRICQQP